MNDDNRTKQNHFVGRGIQYLDSAGKIAGGTLAIIAVLSLIPPVGKYVKGITAWRFGAIGAVRYAVGNSQSELYLLRSGERRWSNLYFGDVVQAKSGKNLRESSDCVATESCGSAPIVFEMQQGQCAVVLEKLYEDPGGGGWIKVATTSCGIFR